MMRIFTFLTVSTVFAFGVSAAWAQSSRPARSSVISQETLDNLLAFAAMDRLTPEQIEELARDGRLKAASIALVEVAEKANLKALLSGPSPDDLRRTYEERKHVDCGKLLELSNKSFGLTVDALKRATISLQRSSQLVVKLDSLGLQVAQVQFSVCNAYKTDWRISGQTWLEFQKDVTRMLLAYQALSPKANALRDKSLRNEATQEDETEFESEVDSRYKLFIELLSNARKAGFPQQR